MANRHLDRVLSTDYLDGLPQCAQCAGEGVA